MKFEIGQKVDIPEYELFDCIVTEIRKDNCAVKIKWPEGTLNTNKYAKHSIGVWWSTEDGAVVKHVDVSKFHDI